ncbi:hypothetical protein [Ferruginibacter profundus]
MFLPLKYGIARTPIGVGEYLIKCPSCETHQWAELLVSGVYSHVWFIPIMPNDKDAMVVCKKCGLKRYGVPFDARLISNYDDVKKLYRHKLFTYTGAIIIAFPFILWLLIIISRWLS